MHYVSKESRNIELIWIRKMTSKEKKNKTIKWKKRQNAYWQISRKETLYKKKTGYFLNRQIVCF